jgi:hypothetical protein
MADWSAILGAGKKLLDALADGLVDFVGWVKINIVYPIAENIWLADWSQVTAGAQTITNAIGEGLNGFGQVILEKVGNPLGQALAQIDPYAFMTMAIGLGLMAAPAIITGIASLATSFGTLAIGAATTLLAMLPIIAPLLIIVGIAAAFQTNFLGARDAIILFGDKLREGWAAWKGIFDNLGTAIDAIKTKFDAWTQPIQDAIDKLTELGEKMGVGGAANPKSVGQSQGSQYVGQQFGGSVFAHRPYLVGEAGPELFIPGASGTVVPNSALRGGRTSAGMPTLIQLVLPDGGVLFEAMVHEGNRRNVQWAVGG